LSEAWRNAPDPVRDKQFYDRLSSSDKAEVDDTLMTAEEFWNQRQKTRQQQRRATIEAANWKPYDYSPNGGSRKYMSYRSRKMKNHTKSKSYKKIRRGKRTKRRRY
jgi:TRAP-type C4-dicarboxylate transport system substrate-binding protein